VVMTMCDDLMMMMMMMNGDGNGDGVLQMMDPIELIFEQRPRNRLLNGWPTSNS
jgi:hypothetical protein